MEVSHFWEQGQDMLNKFFWPGTRVWHHHRVSGLRWTQGYKYNWIIKLQHVLFLFSCDQTDAGSLPPLSGDCFFHFLRQILRHLDTAVAPSKQD